MRIGIDARLALGHRRGMGRVLLNLLTNLLLFDTKNTYFLYVDKFDAQGILPKAPNIKTRVLPPRFYPLWEQISLPIACIKDKLDILHCPANTAPLFIPRRTKLVLTIHDIIFLKPFSEVPLSDSMYQNIGRIYRRICVMTRISRVHHIVTVSQFSGYDIQRNLGIPADRVTVIHNGIDDYFFQDHRENCETFLKTLQVSGRFIFHLGGTSPNKNTIGAIKAFNLLLQEEGYHDLYFVIGGVSSKGNNQIKQFVREKGLEKKVKFINYVTDRELKCLYSNAELFLFPSLYEGFGLPPLEAMACGAPVVASNLTSLPEVVGEAGILVDPMNIDEIKTAMVNIMRNEQLKAKLIKAGKQRVQEFRWKKAAKKLLQVYENSLS
jgi:glycosyltransferase involved in cell wall biosynthesis